jgi:transcriptional regulator with XRE-family HTH domain
MVEMANSAPLGDFLRSRRRGLSPAAVGLASGGRRRTPGLRREELAMLAGISVDYLARLEQGRERSPSAAVLASLSDALRLSRDERRYLMAMVSAVTHEEMCEPAAGPSPLGPTIVTLLDRLHPTPAFVVEGWGEVAAWNQAFDGLMRPAGFFALRPPNLARFTFLSPSARPFFRDWATVAAEQVASLRAAAGNCNLGEPFEKLVGELTLGSPEFARLWASHQVAELARGTRRLVHPVAGDLVLDYEILVLADPGSRRLATYTPADEHSAAAVASLAGDAEPRDARPQRLRVITGGAA